MTTKKTMKNLLYILLFIVVPIVSVAQSATVKPKEDKEQHPTFKNQIDLDVQFLGVDFLYKHRLGSKFFVGGGTGIGYVGISGFLNLNSNGTYAEFTHFKVLFDYIVSKNFHLYNTSTYSLSTYYSDRDNFFRTFKFGLGFFFKISIIEVGIETSILFSQEESGQLVTSLLIIKIPLKRW